MASQPDAAAAAAGGSGGAVTVPPFDSPFGRMAGLVDPDGAPFWVMQTDPSQPGPERTG